MKKIVKSLDKDNYVKVINSEMPIPKENEVVIEVIASSLNFADIIGLKGKYHAISDNFTPGFDCSGKILKVGSKVTKFKVGDRVIGFPNGGGLAEYVSISEDLVYPLNQSISFQYGAAAISIGVTAYELIYKVAKVKKDDTVVVHAAAGGVGILLLQLVKLIGAKAIAIVGSKRKEIFVKKFNADLIINRRNQDIIQEINHFTHGNGATVIFNSVGGKVVENDLKIITENGTLVTYGHSSGEPGLLNTEQIHSFAIKVVGYSSGKKQSSSPLSLYASVLKFMRMVEAKQIIVPIDKVYALNSINAAFKHLDKSDVLGKVVIEFQK